MDKLELLNFIEESRLFEDIGCPFFVVDKDLTIKTIAYTPVKEGVSMCLGDFLKCSNAVSAPGGCGTHANCQLCPLRRALPDSIVRQEQYKGEVSLLLEGNQDYYAQVSTAPFIEEGAPYAVVLFLDRTEQHRKKAMERIFFHDILNLSGAVHGLLDNPDDPEPEKTRAIVRDISYQLMEEIKSQRDLIYAMNGSLKPHKQVLKSSDVLAYLQTHFEKIAKQMFNAELKVESSLGDELLETDRVLLFRVLYNMLKNACESSAGQPVTVKGSLRDGMVRFAVHNAAVMTDEVRSKIFVQGYTTKSTGYGLGTFSMKIIGENYLGGKVSFVSEAGSGTEFSFELPVLPKV